jgi:outer membrane protein
MRANLFVFFLAAPLAGPALCMGADRPAPEPVRTTAELSLEEAAATALKWNASARAELANLDLAGARLQEAKAGRLPTLTFRQGWTRSDNPVFVFGSLLEQARFGAQNFDPAALNDPDPLSNWRTEVSARVALFDQLQTPARVGQARAGVEQAQGRKELAEQRIRLEVVRSYYGVLVAEARREAAEEAVKTGEADVERIGHMVHTGLVVESDLLAAEVQLAEFHQRQIEAAGDVNSAYAALGAVLGQPLDPRPRLSGQLVERSFELPSQEELVRLALERRPEIAGSRAGVQAARQDRRAAAGQFLPRLEAFASWGRSSENIGDGSSDVTGGVQLTLGLFDPGRAPRMAEARAGIALAEAAEQGLSSQIRLEAVQAYERFVSARDRLAVAARAVEQASEALRIVQDRYGAGLTTITEVLRAETALLNARLSVLSARYDHSVGYAGVLLATGGLQDLQPFAATP